MTADNDGEETFHATGDQVLSEERPAYLGAAPVMGLTSDQILVRGAVADILAHFEEALTRLLTDPPTSDNRIRSLLEKLICRAVDKAINTPEELGA